MSQNSFWRFKKGIVLVGETSDAPDAVEGSIFVNSTTNRFRAYVQGSTQEFTTNAQTQTLTNKTLTSPTITTPIITSVTSGSGTFVFNTSGTVTVPNGTDTLVNLNTTQTLQNKTLNTTNTIAINDTNLFILDDLDSTKIVKFQVSGLSTLTTRTFTFPDADTTFVGTGTTQTLTNKTLTGNTAVNLISGSGTLILNTTGTITIPNITDTLISRASSDMGSNRLKNKDLEDQSVAFANVSNTTKRLAFSLGGATANTALTLASITTLDRIITFPNATDTLIGKATTDILTNKSLSGSTNTFTNISLTTAVTGTLPIGNGGTGQTTASAAFNALSPMTTTGDIIYGASAGAGTRLGIGTSGQILTVSAGLPSWQTFTALTNPMTTGGDLIYGGASGTPTRLANGTSGQYLASGGGTSAPVWTSFISPTVQTFTSGSGATYTTPAGVRWLKIRMCGGGGGGSGSGSASLSSDGAAGNASTWKTSLDVTILLANGGNAGFWGSAGGAGGTASVSAGATSIITYTGGGGGSGIALATSGIAAPGGSSGTNIFGGAANTAYATAPGTSIANSGAGGAGGGQNAGTNTYSGTGGGAGGYVEAIITSPSATYHYTVGGTAAAGAAGTGGTSAGGTGAAGIIIVEEYY